MNTKILLPRMLRVATAALASLCALSAQAAAPGITGTSFALNAGDAHITEPDGASLYAWGYGCATGSTPTFLPAMANNNCPTMQLPGPTLIVHEGDVVTVTLTNNLPAAAGNTSILFPGFAVTATGGTPGLLAQEAAHGGSVQYQFTATTPGTHSYYSGTQGDLQIEMGLYGALIVLPATPGVIPGGGAASPCTAIGADAAKNNSGETDFRLTTAAYDNPATCYDREYLFQFSEMDPRIHTQVEQQVLADNAKGVGNTCAIPTGCLSVETEPYSPAYYMINGRSMPDDMDPNYVGQYPNQPYNGNPHMHPGELTLVRIIGQGRWQHPFHEHGNHVRILARDGNLLLSGTDPATAKLAGPLMFTTTTTPGLSMDGIFYWTGKGLNWDVYGHGYAGDTSVCIPDANGYYTADPTAPNYYEWCGDHNKALEKNPFGQVASGGPMTLPDPNVLTNGPWYSGTPYLGPDANLRSVGTTPIPPSGTVANDPGGEAGFAFMWHSHNEREITTNNIFPGGMLMMMLVDPRAFPIDEQN